MPKAAAVPNTSRRSLLTGVGALATVPAVAARPLPDAAIIASVERLQALDTETQQKEDARAPDEEIEALVDAWHEEVVLVIERQAVSVEGVRAKARLMHGLLPLRPDGTLYSSDPAPSERVMWSLVRDLVA